LPFITVLPRFRVFGVLAAARAEFLEPQTIFHVFLVLARLVIALFAIATGHRQNRLILIRHDFPSFETVVTLPLRLI
jgi:hypothetical protein